MEKIKYSLADCANDLLLAADSTLVGLRASRQTQAHLLSLTEGDMLKMSKPELACYAKSYEEHLGRGFFDRITDKVCLGRELAVLKKAYALYNDK